MAMMRHRNTLAVATNAILLGIILYNLQFSSAFPEVSVLHSDVLPAPQTSGYVPVGDGEMFFAYYEASSPPAANADELPIILWLQGGPGCASQFGNFYELGPFLLDANGQPKPNTYAWNERSGLLFLDQPLGTGFSKPGKRGIPRDEMQMASDLFEALQGFFKRHAHLQQRLLFITGESYAGKYVPSIGHYILQVMQQSHRDLQAPLATLSHTRQISEGLYAEAPTFRLAGLAIGDGLTDPETQEQTHADTAYYMGTIDGRQRQQAKAMERHVVRLIRAGKWRKAHEGRQQLLEFIHASSGIATLLDVRRWHDYDAEKHVDAFLNRADVKVALKADPNITFVSCSAEVGKAMGSDVMRSVKHLIPDILAKIPVLLYQGQFDGQDGVATSEAWIDKLKWRGQEQFRKSKRHIWRMPVKGATDGDAVPTRVAGYWKNAGPLTQVVVTAAGHMLPHDQGEAALQMMNTWIASVLPSANTVMEQ